MWWFYFKSKHITCFICFIKATAESDFEKWMKFLFLKPSPCSAEMLPLENTDYKYRVLEIRKKSKSYVFIYLQLHKC